MRVPRAFKCIQRMEMLLSRRTGNQYRVGVQSQFILQKTRKDDDIEIRSKRKKAQQTEQESEKTM